MDKTDTRKLREAKALRANIRKRNLQKNMRHTISEDHLIIKGGNPLVGTVTISGAKNAALPLIFASILSNKPIVLNNVPNLSDIETSIAILKELNAEVTFNNNVLTINPATIDCFAASHEFVSQMRASILVLGPLLAKCKIAKIALPGGCSIGERPIDIHLDCLKQLGAEISEEGSLIVVQVKDSLIGATIEMQKASVGATENLVMAATLAKGTTKIINPAKEPEIIDLVKMLRSMGANITGEGTDLIIIEGVSSLGGTTYTVCPDRIEAGSYAIAAAITGGSLTLQNINLTDLANIIEPLKATGTIITALNNTSIQVTAPVKLIPTNITTKPYPGFPTDMQPQWTTFMTQAVGISKINETIFENRLGYTKELNKMGANINVMNYHEAVINGGTNLIGTLVTPTDLRASFALILAGLIASGTTIVNKLDYLDRGYENIVEKLSKCGANINRVNNVNSAIISNVNLKQASVN